MGLAVCIGSAQADWVNCSIQQTGANNGGYFVTVTDNSPTPNFPAGTTFVLDDSAGRAKNMYAAALTAWANGTNCLVYFVTFGSYDPVFGVAATKY
jgi:hypothetical protein